jgi:rubrerythrin
MGARYAALAGVLAATFLVAAMAPNARTEEGATINALKQVAQRENNAHWQYMAFMMQARREGHPRAANVFRAAAEGEVVHLRNHLNVLRSMDIDDTLDYSVESIVVRSTEENLAAAIAMEAHERKAIYRACCDLATREGLQDVRADFIYAKDAEATHEAFFRTELARLQAEKPGQQLLASAVYDPLLALGTPIPNTRTFVCPGCGRLFDGKPEKSCSLCGTAGSAAFEVH